MQTHNSRFAWSLVLVWMGVIFYLSHQPASASSELSSGLTDLLLQLIEAILPMLKLEVSFWHFLLRKAAHFTAYFILGLLIMNALHGRRPILQEMALALLLSFLYAVSDEVHQLFIPGRSGELRDVLIDTSGALTGILFFYFMVVFIRRLRFRSARED